MNENHWRLGERVTLNHLAVGAVCQLVAAGEVVVRVLSRGARFVVDVVSTGERLEVGGAKHVRRASPGERPPPILGWVAVSRGDLGKVPDGDPVIVSHAGCWRMGRVSGAIMRPSGKNARRYVWSPDGARLSVSIDAPTWRAVRQEAGESSAPPAEPARPPEFLTLRRPLVHRPRVEPEPAAYVPPEPPLPAGRPDLPWVRRPTPVAPSTSVEMREWWYIERSMRDGEERLVFETEGAAKEWKRQAGNVRPVKAIRATTLETEPAGDGLVRMRRPEYRGPKTRRRPPVRERKPYKDDDDED